MNRSRIKTSSEKSLLGVDPGREKVGLALVAPSDGAILWRRIAPRAELEVVLMQLSDWEIERVALGNSTASGEIAALLARIRPDWKVELVDERGSTLEARPLYWQANPPRGWRLLVPLSLQNPPESVDDFAAVVVARRCLKSEMEGRDPSRPSI